MMKKIGGGFVAAAFVIGGFGLGGVPVAEAQGTVLSKIIDSLVSLHVVSREQVASVLLSMAGSVATLSVDSANFPSSNVPASGGANSDEADQVPLLVFDLKGDSSPSVVNSIAAKINNLGPATVTAVYLYDGQNMLDVESPSKDGSVLFPQIDVALGQDTSKVFVIKADIRAASTTGSQIYAQVDSSGIVAKSLSGSTKAFSGSAIGESMYVSSSMLVASVLSATIQTTGATLPMSTTTVVASFSVSLTAVGGDFLFEGAAARPVGVSVYKNGVKSEAFSTYPETSVLAYQVPSSGVTTSPLDKGFVFRLSRNNSVVLPVTFSFVPSGRGFSYSVELDSIRSMSSVTKKSQAYLIRPTLKTNYVIADGPSVTSGPVIAPTVSITGVPTITLAYDSKKGESALTATFDATVRGGSADSSFYTTLVDASFYDQNGQRGGGSARINVPRGEKTDAYGRGYTGILVGESLPVKVVLTASPKVMFAGSYFAKFNQVYLVGSDINNPIGISVPSNKTESKTIVGEVAPYITFVTPEAHVGQPITVQGQRLNGSTVLIDAIAPQGLTYKNSSGKSVTFNLPILSVGMHRLSVASKSTGASNQLDFSVLADPTTASTSASIIGKPSLSLAYEPLRNGGFITKGSREVGLVSDFDITITAGLGDVKIASKGFVPDFINQEGRNLSPNQKYSTVTPKSQAKKILDVKGDAYYIVPAGKAINFHVTQTVDPKQMFAGNYYATLRYISTDAGVISLPSNRTNSTTIVGEVSPYITSVTYDNGSVTIRGVRFHATKNMVTNGGNFTLNNVVSADDKGTTITFPTTGMTTGVNYITVINSNMGAGAGRSNALPVNVLSANQPSIIGISATSSLPGVKVQIRTLGMPVNSGYKYLVSFNNANTDSGIDAMIDAKGVVTFKTPALPVGLYDVSVEVLNLGNLHSTSVPFAVLAPKQAVSATLVAPTNTSVINTGAIQVVPASAPVTSSTVMGPVAPSPASPAQATPPVVTTQTGPTIEPSVVTGPVDTADVAEVPVAGPVVGCTDSDGGKNPNVAGVTESSKGSLSHFKDISVKAGGGACSGASCVSVIEGYCTAAGKVGKVGMKCSTGYSVDGACVAKPGASNAGMAIFSVDGFMRLINSWR
ncbi:MAG: hypothetical protein WC763_03785 [Candidatus Paceibacterota bacterium]